MPVAVRPAESSSRSWRHRTTTLPRAAGCHLDEHNWRLAALTIEGRYHGSAAAPAGEEPSGSGYRPFLTADQEKHQPSRLVTPGPMSPFLGVGIHSETVCRSPGSRVRLLCQHPSHPSRFPHGETYWSERLCATSRNAGGVMLCTAITVTTAIIMTSTNGGPEPARDLYSRR